MQTFLTNKDFSECARVLDRQRLGKQRCECLQILKALAHPAYGWQNHPAVKMWRGAELSLHLYANAICDEWIRRGYRDTCKGKIAAISIPFPLGQPSWVGDERLYSSHRAALLYKNFNWYNQFGWTEEPKLNYWWPSGLTNR